uniref:Alpha-2-macroglobulin domain-containing protein n=1 Tax=Amphilophus citrinellus TaxID=61819 RepID=A0A3Q0RJ06_AMPCI
YFVETKCTNVVSKQIERVPIVRRRTVAEFYVNFINGKAIMSKHVKVLIEPPAFIHIIRTDKPIYKPGQTVKFRIVSMDANFIPVERDPSSNRIAQWLDKSVVGGILDLSHPMIPEAVQGSYSITALTDKGEKISHKFDIKEYVLPKYEVKVHLPSVITILDQEATLKICGKYTYGKPVIGSVKAEFCRIAVRFFWYSLSHEKDLCKTYEMTVSIPDVNRDPYCAEITVLFEYFFFPIDSFEVTAEMEEYGTGVMLKGYGGTTFTSYIRTLNFEDVPEAYKPGIPFEGKVKVVGPDSKPVANEPVYLFVGGSLKLTLSTDMKGVALFSLDTSLWKDTVHLTASSKNTTEHEPHVHGLRRPDYRLASQHVTPFYSKSSSFLKLMQVSGMLSCDKDAAVGAQYIIQGEELNKGQEVLDFFYLVCLRDFNKGELSVPLSQVTDLAPFAQVVVYTLMPSGEAVADSHNFPIQLCLNNKVSLKFSSLQELPAERTTLTLQAHPGSVCSVRAIDQSVLLLQTEQELTVNYLPVQKLSGYTYDAEDSEPYPCYSLPVPEAARRETRSLYYGPVNQKNDVYSIFKVEHLSFLLAAEYIESNVINSGLVKMEQTTPDTITKWAAGAFCVSSVGFGVAPNTGLTVFQPFFVSLTLPYSVIRGEVFTLKATVFNYLSKCIMVEVTLATSDHYTFRNCDGCIYRVCLCGEESRTFSWIVTPTTLGKVNLKVSAEALKTETLCGNEVATVPNVGQIDTVIRTLLVEVSDISNTVDCAIIKNLLTSMKLKEKKISLLMPELFVAGSARASVSLLGDLMGRAMQNLDKLLAMPYGCGEQNMVLFAPNIFILNYLKSTGQLTQSILDKATHFLESGYQRELTYKHDDGSYSAFGKQDTSGNTWLTSFVMKSFGGARSYIYVQPKHIEEARMWLSTYRRPHGCIRSVGKLFHNGMKGGVSDDVSLTAYIIAAMLELDTNATDPVVQHGLNCLQAAVAGQLDNLYTTALMSYTFTLAGDEEMRRKLITLLHQKSHIAGASGKGLDSLEVEMTSYVLLALLSGPSIPGFGLDYSAGIAHWLTQQQNPYGGFASTQDTVVALQALAKYGAATYSSEGSTTVTVTSLGGLNKEFTVNQDNRLLYQEEKLSEVPGEYTIRAQGQNCVLTQISMHYNIPPPADFSAFNISAITMAKCNISRPQLILFVHVRYQGRREETNMVIINIKLLSGYILDKTLSTVNPLQIDRSVKRVDVEEGFINIYLDGLKKDEMQIYSVTLEEDQPVRNLKPAVVKVYDYYQTSKNLIF